MNQFFLLLLLSATLLINCKDDCGEDLDLVVDRELLQQEIIEIDAYLSENGIQAQEHPTGLRYRILDEGDGDRPDLCGQVVVQYKGEFLSNGNVFDESDRPATFALRNLITGWKIGLPLIRDGGIIELYIPSVYAYGSQERGSIPPNSILYFRIVLLDSK